MCLCVCVRTCVCVFRKRPWITNGVKRTLKTEKQKQPFKTRKQFKLPPSDEITEKTLVLPSKEASSYIERHNIRLSCSNYFPLDLAFIPFYTIMFLAFVEVSSVLHDWVRNVNINE